MGLLAGNGRFPIEFARAASRHGVSVVAIGLKKETSPELENYVDEIHWTGLAKLGKWIKIFKNAGVEHAVMCGGVEKSKMYPDITRYLPDLRSMKVWYENARSRADHTLLEAVVREFKQEGIAIESSVLYCPDLLAEEGTLTKLEPSDEQWEDIRFGWSLAKQIARMQIGQTIVVKDKAVIAVEGMDGTDATIKRGGRIAGEGTVVIKVAKENHDPRFDIPCIGPETVDVLSEAGAAVLAVAAGNTIVLNDDATTARAEKAGVVITAVSPEQIGDGDESRES